jgi:hypothetical protein
MKKSELTDLIERKRILKESLDMINESQMEMDEVGGFDDPELMSQYHSNYYDELTKIFFHFDQLSNELVESMSKSMDDEEKRKCEEILKKYVSFMEEYHNFLLNLKRKVQHLSFKSSRENLPGMGNIGVNENY